MKAQAAPDDIVETHEQGAGNRRAVAEVGGLQTGGQYAGAQGSERRDNLLLRLTWAAGNHPGAGDLAGQAGTQRVGFGGEDTVCDIGKHV